MQALPDIHNIPLPALIPQISRVVGDDELVDFFQGYEYRFDILEKIDLEVAGLVDSLYHGQRVTFAERKLVVFALYGNVVDTYKYYEYNYQSEWLAHRYLPEHGESPLACGADHAYCSYSRAVGAAEAARLQPSSSATDHKRR